MRQEGENVPLMQRILENQILIMKLFKEVVMFLNLFYFLQPLFAAIGFFSFVVLCAISILAFFMFVVLRFYKVFLAVGLLAAVTAIVMMFVPIF